MSDPIPPRTFWSLDRQCRAQVVQRSNGAFQIFEEWHLYDDDTGVWYWSGPGPMHMFEGLYQDAEPAEAEIQSMPRYWLPDSN